MIEGQFSAGIFFKTISYLVLITLVVIYAVAVELGQEPPIPKTYISSCAGHYPNFIIFRITTISGSVLIILGWFVNHFFIRSLCLEQGFRIKKYRPEISLILGEMGGVGLMGSTANIDTGIRNGTWHQHCAAVFFLFTTLAIFYNTFIYWVVERKTSCIGKRSMNTKLLLVLAMLLQALISYKYGY